MRVFVSASAHRLLVIASLLTFMLAASVSFASAGEPQRSATSPQQIDSAATTHYRLGLRLMSSEYWDDAAKEFQQAIDLDPKFTLAYYWLGRARMANQRYADAIKSLVECRDLYLAELGTRASNQLEANQKRSDRLREIRELIRDQQIAPASPGRDRTIMQLENLASDIEAQATGASMDFVLHPPAFVSLSLGSAYFRSNNMTAAEEQFRAAIAANPRWGRRTTTSGSCC